MFSKFELGVRRSTPFCRCVVMPTGTQYEVLNHVDSTIAEGLQYLDMPAGCLPFRNLEKLLIGDKRQAKPSLFQRGGIFIWRNREYLVQHPPPDDVEDVYLLWIERMMHISRK